MLPLVGAVVGIALAIFGARYFIGALFEDTGATGVMKRKTSLVDAALVIVGVALLVVVTIYMFQKIILGGDNILTWATGILDDVFSGTSIIDIMPK